MFSAERPVLRNFPAHDEATDDDNEFGLADSDGWEGISLDYFKLRKFISFCPVGHSVTVGCAIGHHSCLTSCAFTLQVLSQLDLLRLNNRRFCTFDRSSIGTKLTVAVSASGTSDAIR